MQQVTLAIHGAPADLLEIDSAFTQRGLVTNQFLNGIGLHVAFNTNDIYMDIVNQLNMTFQEYQGVHSIAIQGNLYLVDDASLIVGGMIMPVKFINLYRQEEYIDRLSNYVSRHRGDRRRGRFAREERNMIERQSSRASRSAPFWDRDENVDYRSRRRSCDSFGNYLSPHGSERSNRSERRTNQNKHTMSMNEITSSNTYIDSLDESKMVLANVDAIDIKATENGLIFVELYDWLKRNIEEFDADDEQTKHERTKALVTRVLSKAGMIAENTKFSVDVCGGDAHFTWVTDEQSSEANPSDTALIANADVSYVKGDDETNIDTLSVNNRYVTVLCEEDGITFVELDSVLSEVFHDYDIADKETKIKMVAYLISCAGLSIEPNDYNISISSGDVLWDLISAVSEKEPEPTPVAGEITTVVLSEKVLASTIKQVTKIFAGRDQRKSVDAIRCNGVVYLRNGDVVSAVHITANPKANAITFHIGEQLRGLSAYRISTFVKAFANAVDGKHTTDKLNHNGDLVIAFDNYEEISVADYVMETTTPEEPTISEPKSGLVSVEEMKPVTEEYVIDETPQLNVIYVGRVEDTYVEMIGESDGTITLRYNIASVRAKTNRVSLYGRVITELGNYLMEEGFTDEDRTRAHWVMTIKGEYAYLRGYDDLNPQESWIKVSDALEMQFLNTYISSI